MDPEKELRLSSPLLFDGDRIFLYLLSSWYANAHSEIIVGRVTYSQAKNRLKETKHDNNTVAVHL
jgi:hypothetical protein